MCMHILLCEEIKQQTEAEIRQLKQEETERLRVLNDG